MRVLAQAAVGEEVGGAEDERGVADGGGQGGVEEAELDRAAVVGEGGGRCGLPRSAAELG
jgi:hypothetical protein